MLPLWICLSWAFPAVVNPIRSTWWLLLFPSALLGSTLLCLNFLGDGLRDAFDPRSRTP